MTAATASRITAATIRPGTVCLAGYRGYLDQNTFLGFASDRCSWHGDCSGTAFYSTYRELKSHIADEDAHYATFISLDGDVWQAYRYKGRWVVGTSADALKLAPAA